jgi:uroporphyrinogen-III synthase
MEALIIRHGGAATVAPSVVERRLEDNTEAFVWAERLFAGEFEIFIATTATGLSYLRDAIVTRHPLERLTAALRKTITVTRGPKPVPVFAELGVPVSIKVPEPNTWREVLDAVVNFPQRKVALQEYGRPSVELIGALRERDYEVTPVHVYRWELPADRGPLERAARGLARREFDVLIFTTSVQLVHLLEVAAGSGLEREVLQALREDVVVSSVGPIMTAALADHGLEPDIVPAHPKMGPLVRVTAEQATTVLAQKRLRTVCGSSK